jgi:hypothetical protein
VAARSLKLIFVVTDVDSRAAVGSQNLWTPAALRFSKAFPPFG